jgi:hypothetical protein
MFTFSLSTTSILHLINKQEEQIEKIKQVVNYMMIVFNTHLFVILYNKQKIKAIDEILMFQHLFDYYTETSLSH